MLISDSRFDLVWFRLSCDHGWIRSGSVNVRKQQQQQQQHDNVVPPTPSCERPQSNDFEKKTLGLKARELPTAVVRVRAPLLETGR